MKLRYHIFALPKSFRSNTEVARYATDQKEKFESLEDTGTNDFAWWARQIRNNWETLADSASSNRTDLNSVLASHPVFLFDSVLAQHLKLMVAQGRRSAVSELVPALTGSRSNLAGSQLKIEQISAHSEIGAIASFEYKAKKGANLRSLESLVDEHEARLEQLLESDRTELEEKRATFDEMLTAANEKFERIEQRVKRAIEARQDDWEATHNAFIEQLKTETAVELWANRSANHLSRYETQRSWTIGFGLVGLAITIAWIFGGFALARWMFSGDTTAQVAAYTAGSIAIFTLYVWGLRVLIRTMMSEDHLATDASARSALAHTYLSLIKDEAATQEDRAIVLASLFTPVSDGLVKDDGMPTLSPTAMAAQILTRP